VCICHSRYTGSAYRTVVQAGPDINVRHYLKKKTKQKTKAERAEGVAQMVESLFCKYKALNSNPVSTRERDRNREIEKTWSPVRKHY
jgi:hypothetical protein